MSVELVRRRQLQVELNRASEHLWSDYAGHRSRVTALVLAAVDGRPPGTIAILGAGNLNDIDVRPLIAAGHELHLLDIDPRAVEAALRRHGIGPGSVHVDSVDLLAPGALAEDGFDVVVSCNVLTQLIDQHLSFVVGSDDGPERISDAHVRAVRSAVRPGGVGIVIVDVVSSDTADLRVGEAQLATALLHYLEAGNFFSGCNPFAIGAMIDREAGAPISAVSLPWRWSMGERTYLCCGVGFVTP